MYFILFCSNVIKYDTHMKGTPYLWKLEAFVCSLNDKHILCSKIVHFNGSYEIWEKLSNTYQNSTKAHWKILRKFDSKFDVVQVKMFFKTISMRN